MGRYNICVYAICKNEAAFVESWMASMSEADMVVVTDTGSTDNTVEALKSCGATVHTETIRPWRFDEARNRSLSHVPDDVDICVCTDLDERFQPGWRACLEAAWSESATMGNYLYNWSLKPDGTPDTQFTYFKVHTRREYRWAYPIHECLQYIGQRPEHKVFVPGMVLNHYPDSAKSRSSYLPLLELAVEEDPDGDRMMYYLGREYLYAGEWERCIQTLQRHLALPAATWKEERCASMRWIAKSHRFLGDTAKAFSWYCRAIGEAPHLRDPYVECAQMGYALEDWPMVYYMTQAALRIKERSKSYVNMGYSWDETPHDLAAIACYRLGMYAQAAKHAENALALAPEDQRLRENLRLILQKA